MRWALRVLAPLLILGAIAYAFRMPLRVFSYQTAAKLVPCTVPVTYRIGGIDPRFGISTSSLEASLKSAAGLWSAAAGKPLFAYAPRNGVITVNLVYDTRQETTSKLKKIGITVRDDLNSYTAAKAKYQTVYADYLAKKRAFDAAYAALQHQSQLYEQEVNRWNARGGAPRDVYDQLQKRKQELDREDARVRALSLGVNAAADNVNALVIALNHLAKALNISANTYNTVGAAVGEEFEEALFESIPGKQDINVYEFDTARGSRVCSRMNSDTRSALSMWTMSAPSCIRLNISANDALTQADTAELARVCRTGS